MMRSLISTTLRRKNQRFLSSLSTQRTSPAASAATLLRLEETFTDSQQKNAFPLALLMMSGLAVSYFGTTTDAATSMTKCEEESATAPAADAAPAASDDAAEVDPYDNLPEEDEPTHCSICMTYRQGPCRPFWRKVEACTKDNELKKDDDGEKKEEDAEATKKEGEEEGSEEPQEQADPPCLKYMMPWIDCATGFRNLYNLIELDTNYTLGIADLEKDATENLYWVPGKGPSVDWTSWQEYVAENKWKPAAKKEVDDSDAAEKKSLWKTLDQSQDPELCQVEGTVPMFEGDGVLECAYAVDQDGNVMGFTYGKKPSEASEKSEDDPVVVELKIRILPSHARSMTIAASYTKPKKEDAKEDDPLESHIYRTKPFSLKSVGKTKKKKTETKEN